MREHNYALTPGRYVGSADNDDDEEEFEIKFKRLKAELDGQFAESAQLEQMIRDNLQEMDSQEQENRANKPAHPIYLQIERAFYFQKNQAAKT